MHSSAPQQVWHPDVRLFKVVMRGKPRGFLYLDPYVRPGQKQEGAWTAPLALRSRLSASPGRAVALPVVAVVFNFPRPVGDKPSLLSWRWAARLRPRAYTCFLIFLSCSPAASTHAGVHAPVMHWCMRSLHARGHGDCRTLTCTCSLLPAACRDLQGALFHEFGEAMAHQAGQPLPTTFPAWALAAAAVGRRQAGSPVPERAGRPCCGTRATLRASLWGWSLSGALGATRVSWCSLQCRPRPPGAAHLPGGAAGVWRGRH